MEIKTQKYKYKNQNTEEKKLRVYPFMRLMTPNCKIKKIQKYLRVHPSMRLMTPKPSREVGIVEWGQCISTGTCVRDY